MEKIVPALCRLGMVAIIPLAAAAPAFAETPWAKPSGFAPDIRLELLARHDGVPLDPVYQTLEDRQGYLWFATNAGLIRYDGYRHVVYSGMPTVRIPPLTTARPGRLFEDGQGALWVATHVLTRFDRATGKFTETINPRPGEPRPGVDSISALHVDARGTVWLGIYSYSNAGTTPKELSEPVLYELRAKTRGPVEHRMPAEITAGQAVTIRAIEEDARGRLWLGTPVGLVRFDRATGEFRLFAHVHPLGDHPAQKALSTLARDRTGHLWVHQPDGIERFDPETGEFDRFVPSEHAEFSVDQRGRFWLRNDVPGIEVFDPSATAEAALRAIYYVTPSGQPMSELDIESIGADRQGNVWVAPTSGGGLLRFSASLARFGKRLPELNNPDSLSGGTAMAFAEDESGFVWISTLHSGLNRYDPRTGSFTRFRHDPRNPGSLIDDGISALYLDRAGTLWIGNGEGIGRFDRNTGRYTLLRGSKLNRQVTSMFEDRGGRFWVGAMMGPMHQVERQSGRSTDLAFKGGYITFEDRSGGLWFGASPGVNRLDAAGNARLIPLRQPDAANPASTVVTAIHEDPRGLLWMSSNKGLFTLDPNTEQVTSYANAEGAPTEDLRCMLPDDDGNFWFGTSLGISRFDVRERRFTNFDDRDGLQGREFMFFSCMRARDGRLYFGGRNGFNAFYPREVLAAHAAAPRVAVTAYEIDGRRRPATADKLQLGPAQNTLTFEFAALNAQNPGVMRYRFRLEPLESKWTEADSERRQARYTELSPREYVFRVEASRDGRTWSGSGASLGVAIAPPWWRTWPALLGAVMLFVGSLTGAHKLRVRVHRRRAEELSAVVEERTAELARERDRAQAGDRAKSAFLANMSHELRTPLNAILGFSTLMREEVSQEQHREQLDIINASGEHLLGMINDVLDLAKVEAGKLETRTAPADLPVLAKEAIAMLRGAASAKGLSLEACQSPDFPCRVIVDGPKLRQILINLLGNAVKFTQQGGVTLRMSVVEPEGERLLLRFEVEDTGPGISAEDQARIFEPFVQAGGGMGQRGTGLGLTITRRFAEVMGGNVTLDSAPGHGSRFVVDLPAIRAGEEESTQTRSDHLFRLEMNQPEQRVLVVDDEPANARLLHEVLTRAGFRCRTANCGRDAIAQFTQWRPHFIWMDQRMPDISGVEAARQIREMEGGKEVKIAALTASAFSSDRERILTGGGLDDFVRKPFRPAEIFGSMSRLLGVRYTEPEEARAGAATVLKGEAIARIPAALRKEVEESVIALDAARIRSAIAKVAEHDTAVGSALGAMAERLEYTALRDAIQGANAAGG